MTSSAMRTKLKLDVRQVQLRLAAGCAAVDRYGLAADYANRFKDHHNAKAAGSWRPKAPSNTIRFDQRRLHKLLAGGCEKCWLARNNARNYSFKFLIHHLVGANDSPAVMRCFQGRFHQAKKEAGFSANDIWLDVITAMGFFADRRDIAAMFFVASSFGLGVEGPRLPMYESYFIWYGHCLRAINDENGIEEVVAYIQGQPTGQERLRMAAELMIALHGHPRITSCGKFQSELLNVSQQPEASGLDLLAAEALGDLDNAFSLALAEAAPKPQRLCRIFKLIRRHPDHPMAPDVFDFLLRNRPRTWSAAFDATVACAGLLARSRDGYEAQHRLVQHGYFSGHEPTAEAAQIAVYLADAPEMVEEIMEEALWGQPKPLALQRAVLYLAWFHSKLRSLRLVQTLIKRRAYYRPCTAETADSRCGILNGHLDHFGFIYSSLRGYTWSPHAALAVPVFSLWARLLTHERDLQLATIKDLSRLSPPCEQCFNNGEPAIGAWIELGHALSCEGKSGLARVLLNRLHELTRKPAKTHRHRISGVFFNAVLLPAIGIIVLATAATVTLALVTLLLLAVILTSLYSLPRQLSLVWNWYFRRPCPLWFVKLMESKNARSKRPPLWLQFGNTWTWQMAAVLLLEVGRADLAAITIQRKDYGNAFRELRPWCFRDKRQLAILMDLFIAVTRDRDDMNKYDWRKFAEEIKKDLGKKESSSLYLAGLPLVEKGIFTIAHIRKIARRFHGDAKASFEAESDIEAITACFGRLGDIPKNLETMNDLPSGCRDFGSVNTTNHYRIAAGLLKVAMTCSRDTLAEVIHALSRWQSLRSKQTAAAARESYFAAIGMEAEANTWKRNPVSFQIFRQVRVLNGILVQPGYSQPFDLLGFAVREMIRRIRRW